MTEMREPDLIAAARRGDRDAFEHLVRQYEKKVLALTCRICANPEDGAEEAFLSAWKGLPSFREEASFSTWLYRLACNASTDILRREARQRAHAGPSLDDETARIDLPDSAPSPQRLAEQAELKEQISAALDALSPEHRQVLILRETHQLSYEEIGRVLSLDVGTVKSRVSRARGKLRRILLSNGNFSAPVPSKEAGKEGGR